MLGDINVRLRQIHELLTEGFDGEEEARAKGMDPEFEARWQRNHDRLQALIERRLAQEGATREEALRRLQTTK